MERLAELIGKLKEQFEQNADQAQLLLITRMIQDEIQRSMKPVEKSPVSSKVAVMMPAARNHATESPAFANTSRPEEKKEPSFIVTVPKEHERYQPAQKIEEAAAIQTGIKAEPIKEEQSAKVPEPLKETVPPNHHPIEEQFESIDPHPPIQPAHGWHYDTVKDIPTLAHQEIFQELNEVIGIKDASLNDTFKAEVIEVAHKLNESPIRDLKRAIGINDRYTFINELFRGDEAMYERSLKTINAFRIYAEAEYWIERELKVKLGWSENKPATRHFYQLIKRRFT